MLARQHGPQLKATLDRPNREQTMTINNGYWVHLYFRGSTVEALENTLERLGALRDRQTQDGWQWTFDSSHQVAELHMINNWDSYALDLVGELLEMVTRCSRALGGEPTVACIINREASSAGKQTTQRFVKALLESHRGFCDDERKGDAA